MKLHEAKTLSGFDELTFKDNQDYLEWLEKYASAIEDRVEHYEAATRSLHSATSDPLGSILTWSQGVAGYVPIQVAYKYYNPRAGSSQKDQTLGLRADKAKDPNFIRYVKNIFQKAQDAKLKLDDIHRQLKQAKKAVAGEKLKQIGAHKSKPYTVQQVNKALYPSSIPKKKNSLKFDKGLKNPIWEDGATDLYVGPPLDYPDLSKPMKLVFVQLEEVLKELGYKGFSVLYGARVKKIGTGISFLAIAADGDFIWQKKGGNTTTNVIHMKGYSWNANRFLAMTKEKQKQELKKYMAMS